MTTPDCDVRQLVLWLQTSKTALNFNIIVLSLRCSTAMESKLQRVLTRSLPGSSQTTDTVPAMKCRCVLCIVVRQTKLQQQLSVTATTTAITMTSALQRSSFSLFFSSTFTRLTYNDYAGPRLVTWTFPYGIFGEWSSHKCTVDIDDVSCGNTWRLDFL